MEFLVYLIAGLLILVLLLQVMLLMKKPDTSKAEQVIWNMQKALGDGQQAIKEDVFRAISAISASSDTRLSDIRSAVDRGNTLVRADIDKGMVNIRQELDRQLTEIRGVVDEKLQTTLERRIAESFKSVSDQLNRVHKGLGEMQSLANDVGSLKQVLSGVKTRGVLGEYQLQQILEEIFHSDQYDTNVETVPGSGCRVEFALKLPGLEEDTVYLPIDSKLPGDTYAHLQEARESGDKAMVERAGKELERRICEEAKDIRAKYVAPPYTTGFAIMFLPFEGLYAEVVNRGMVERLQREYQVNVAGPSTMAALLNSLQMGFKTLAIQRRSNEVWRTLSEVKEEFTTYHEAMLRMQKQLKTVSNTIDSIVSTRTNQMLKKLQSVETLEKNS